MRARGKGFVWGPGMGFQRGRCGMGGASVGCVCACVEGVGGGRVSSTRMKVKLAVKHEVKLAVFPPY